MTRLLRVLGVLSLLGMMGAVPALASGGSQQSYDITTLAGKVASVNGTAGLQIRFSAFIEEEADDGDSASSPAARSARHVLTSPLDGTSVTPPAVTVNQDTAAAPQNETAIAVRPQQPEPRCRGRE